LLPLPQIRKALRNEKIEFGQKGHAAAVKTQEERLGVLRDAQRKRKFELESKQFLELQRRSSQHREIGSIASTVPEDDLAYFAKAAKKAAT
jgi:hypothetical protein